MVEHSYNTYFNQTIQFYYNILILSELNIHNCWMPFIVKGYHKFAVL